MADKSSSTSHSSHGSQGSDAKNALSMRDQMRETKLPSSFYSDSDILLWLKGLAIDPGCGKVYPGSAPEQWNQSLELRKLLLAGNPLSPRSKRELDQFLRDLVVKESDDHVKRICEEYDTELEKALRSLIVDDDLLTTLPSAHLTASLRSEERNHKACDILRRVFADGKYPPMSVPIGRDFQADVPEWSGPVNRNKLYSEDGDSKVSRWSGTRMWPINGRKCGAASKKVIGKGRPDSCSCVSPGSIDCVELHIHETRLCLQSEIGPAFCSWKFDEMGEFASKSWTLIEQRTFESLVRKNPLSSVAGFWKLAFKRFPDKRKKSIVSYYYNVFIPRRMRLATRASPDKFDSDDD
ncbi:AT-rich interactive domain-containing protein 2-like [Argentina anserina]|uniref:AT-rich interactive domain-containing protein 2-like n=1 Tax=Argentina anserina TaxID=57926 RepID=UPI002176371B|nr:AT-rich interactive domain-containing protein 2-like [Potentilla anserina]